MATLISISKKSTENYASLTVVYEFFGENIYQIRIEYKRNPHDGRIEYFTGIASHIEGDLHDSYRIHIPRELLKSMLFAVYETANSDVLCNFFYTIDKPHVENGPDKDFFLKIREEIFDVSDDGLYMDRIEDGS